MSATRAQAREKRGQRRGTLIAALGEAEHARRECLNALIGALPPKQAEYYAREWLLIAYNREINTPLFRANCEYVYLTPKGLYDAQKFEACAVKALRERKPPDYWAHYLSAGLNAHAELRYTPNKRLTVIADCLAAGTNARGMTRDEMSKTISQGFAHHVPKDLDWARPKP